MKTKLEQWASTTYDGMYLVGKSDLKTFAHVVLEHEPVTNPDDDLNDLLNLTADYALGKLEGDAALAWAQALDRVENRMVKVYPDVELSEAQCFAFEAALQHGFEMVDDDANVLSCTGVEVHNMLTAVSDHVCKERDEAIADAHTLANVLETMINGLKWNIENHPTVMNESDAENLAEAQSALKIYRGDPAVTCNNGECGWTGHRSDTKMLGEVGPLCPECGETVEEDAT